MRHGLKPETIDRINEVFARHPEIEQVMLYGSRAKGNFRNGSDVDLCLRGESLSLRQLLRIENELDELMLPYKIDLSIFHQLDNPDVIEQINLVGAEFYRKARAK